MSIFIHFQDFPLLKESILICSIFIILQKAQEFRDPIQLKTVMKFEGQLGTKLKISKTEDQGEKGVKLKELF